MARLHFRSSFIDLFFLAGSTLLLLLIVLSGSSRNPSFPLDHFYWLEADTSDIPNAYANTRWTYWGLCEKVGSVSKNCYDIGPAIPISPVDNFETETNIPDYVVNNRDTFYYLSRVAWACLLISLVFTGISLIICLSAIFSFHLQKLTAIFTFIASTLQFAAAALYTATVALAKQYFVDAKIGPALMGFVWASAVCNLIVLVTTFGACVREAYLRAKERHAVANGSVYTENEKHSELLGNLHHHHHQQAVPALPVVSPTTTAVPPQQPQPVVATDVPVQQFEDPYAATTSEEPATKSGGINFFKVKRNRKSDEESDL
ncbi:hypothetical protein DASC09_056050 [Saccharomycopsis crataegensis]|uniref:Uncharacterized protein n=1 Tax=Saccharomycopsis crataegensis TaxID=43959 RepID=A0AAV5QUQ8_9ASCO|nr:hypothetical protein DASC09_056050 [Saccharomycopsis crataegensis]